MIVMKMPGCVISLSAISETQKFVLGNIWDLRIEHESPIPMMILVMTWEQVDNIHSEILTYDEDDHDISDDDEADEGEDLGVLS